MSEQPMDILATIAARRSVRRYQARPVEREHVLAVLDAARRAPSAANAQPWDFVVVDDPDLRTRVAGLVLAAHEHYYDAVRVVQPGEDLTELRTRVKGFADAPVWIVVCLHRRRRYVREGQEERTFLWDVVSAAAAMENLLLAARALGLGTCWLGVPSLREDSLREILGIPRGVAVIGVTPLGYPAEDPAARPRLPLEEVAHFNRW